MVEVRELTPRFGEFTAVDGITFDVREGEAPGLGETRVELTSGMDLARHVGALVALAGHVTLLSLPA